MQEALQNENCKLRIGLGARVISSDCSSGFKFAIFILQFSICNVFWQLTLTPGCQPHHGFLAELRSLEHTCDFSFMHDRNAVADA